MPSPFSIREFRPEDFSALGEIYRDLDPETKITADRLRHADETLNSKAFRRRWVAEKDGLVIASSILTQDHYFWHPRQFYLNIWVRKAFQNQGVGTALFNVLWKVATQIPMDWIQCAVLHARPEGIRFLAKREFKESHRTFQSHFDLSKFDLAEEPLALAALEAHGIQIKTFGDLERAGISYVDSVYALHEELYRDIPGTAAQAHMSLDDFKKHLDRDFTDRDACILAYRDGQMIGIHFGFAGHKTVDQFHIALTGVLKPWRGQGIAGALKTLGLARAKRKGFKTVSTSNDTRNAPILAINEKTGFVREPALVHMRFSLSGAEPTQNI